MFVSIACVSLGKTESLNFYLNKTIFHFIYLLIIFNDKDHNIAIIGGALKVCFYYLRTKAVHVLKPLKTPAL